MVDYPYQDLLQAKHLIVTGSRQLQNILKNIESKKFWNRS